ncbi:MAG: ABC transporter substrate-binding protein [Lachnospiraceae bacterium]|nr:ABC transporter substrate-binding protein [Lachnospiraceae bacterium]
MNKKAIAVALSSALALSSFVGGMSVSAEESSESVQRSTITIAGTDPSSLDPFNTQTATNVFLWCAYEMLYDVDSDGNFVAVLADASRGEYGGYDHEDGTNKYTVYIYDYIYDSEGNHITAEDVVFSMEARMASGEATNCDAWDHCEAVDETTIDFYFEREMNYVGDLNEYFARTVIFSQAAYEASESGFMQDAVGTGRYVITDYSAGLSMTLEKRDEYWQTDESLISQNHQANVDTIVYQFISEEAQKVIALQTGTVDLVESLSTTSLGDFQEGGSFDDQYDVYSYPDNLTCWVGPNCNEESLLNDINMRMAIFYAIDADGVTAGLGEGAATRAYTVGNYKYPDYNTEWDTTEDYETVTDNDLVQQYLDAAGYNGETIRIIAAEMANASTICEIVQQMLLNAGINCTIEVMDYPTFTSASEDPSAWDLQVAYMAGNSYVVSVWKNVFMTNAEQYGLSGDENLLTMLSSVLTEEGHTEEALTEFRNYLIENAYAMGLCVDFTNVVYDVTISSLATNDMNAIIPGGCTYTAE